MISIIVAIAENNAIGKNNQLLWHIPADLKRFKTITSGHPVIMGKKTWESLPKKPLPNRRNIILTDNPHDSFEGGECAFSLEEALNLCSPREETFIIGGASVYKQFLPHCDRLYLTRVYQLCDGDVFFPAVDFSQWRLISQEDVPPDGTNNFSYSNMIYEKIPS